jgi:hypothetical protein
MVAIIKKGATKKELHEANKQLHEGMPPRKKFDANKFCGAVKFQEDGLEIQKKLRDEWR